MKPLSVLLIEDNDYDAELTERILFSHSEHELTRSATLDEALNIIAQNPDKFDLILTDLNLPDSSGINTISSIANATDVPIVVLTGYGEDNVLVECIEAGAHTVLHKGEVNGNLKDAILAATAGFRRRRQENLELCGYIREKFAFCSTPKEPHVASQ